MSGSYRHVGVALAGLAALVCAVGIGAYWGSLYGPDKKQYQAVANDQVIADQYQGVTASLPEMAGIPEPIERAIANPAPSSGQDHEQRDLAAQEAMSVWGFWMAFAAMWTLVVTSGGTLLIWQQVRLTRKAVEDTGEATKAMGEANRIARSAQRAWLRVTFDGGGIAIDAKDGALWITEVQMQNVGNSPAYDIHVGEFWMLNGLTCRALEKSSPIL